LAPDPAKKNLHLGPQNGKIYSNPLELGKRDERLKPAKNSKLPKLPENCVLIFWA
jgi:hypothetical protein